MPEITTGQISGSELTVASALYRNLESHSGQLWQLPPIMSATQEVKYGRSHIVKAARHVERYSEHIRGAIDKKADMVTGARLSVRATPDFDALGITDKEEQQKIRKSFESQFHDWGYDSRLLQDAEGHYDFGGMSWLGMRNLTGPDAEVAGVIHYDEKRRKSFNHRWATYVEMVDPDRIDTPLEKAANPNVVEGRITDKHGRMVGLYVRKKHPGDVAHTATDFDYEMVPRESKTGRPIGFHWFVKTRAGQMRGVSTLVTILKQSNMLDKFDDAYLASATINQTLATYIESEGTSRSVANSLAPAAGASAEDTWSLFGNKLDYYNDTKMRVGGARIPVLPPGDKINMTGVNRAINDPTQFRNGWLRQFASSIGVSFEQLSKNMSDANFSAARMAILDIWMGIMKMRWWYGQHVCNLIYTAVLEEAIKKGRTALPTRIANNWDEHRVALTKCKWIGPAMPQVDPEKDARAQGILLEKRLESRTHLAAERGRDVEDIFSEIAEEHRDAEQLEFTLEPEVFKIEEEAANDEEASSAAEDNTDQPKKKSSGNERDGDGDGVVNEEGNT